MRRLVALTLGILLTCGACSDDAPRSSEAADASMNMDDGPVPDGTIVDIPMDSISNQDMTDGNEDSPFEDQVVESDR